MNLLKQNTEPETKMAKYQITSDGNLVGSYEGETSEDAIQSMIEDAGYETMDEMCEAGSTNPEDIEAIEAIEVE